METALQIEGGRKLRRAFREVGDDMSDLKELHKRLADDVLFIHKGRLLEHSPANAFFETPASGEAAAFLRGDLGWCI